MSTHAPENIHLPSPTPSESGSFVGENVGMSTAEQNALNLDAGSPISDRIGRNETIISPPAPAHTRLTPVAIDTRSALPTAAPVRTSRRRRASNASSTSSDIPLPPPRQPRQPARPPISTRIRRALGLATPKASLIWRLAFGTSTLIVIGVLLGLSSRPGSIPPDAQPFMIGGSRMSQWQACDRPLGAWNIVWAVKTFLGLGMAGWEYKRAIRPSTDQLLAVERARLGREVRRARRNNPNLGRLGSPTSPTGPTTPNGPTTPRSLPRQWTMGSGREEDLDMIDATMSGSTRSIEIVREMRRIRNKREHEERWYSRCSSFQVLYGLVWFVTANILLYGSLNSCRYTSPYIWWLTFSLLCLGYLVVAEMVLVALVVFVIGPLVYVTINIILVCMGRHPIQPGGRMGHINPDVPKMPRTMVDRIPLVMYIPTTTATTTEPTVPEPAHAYPPPTSKPTTAVTKRRFFFFKKAKKLESEQKKSKPDDVEAAEWENNEYPFVKLEANRAACAICLTDFEPPRRVGQEGESAAEPLRLLACGHVFHKECLDPWLVDVSGRCPTCQRPVEEGDLDPEEGGKKNKRRWRRGR